MRQKKITHSSSVKSRLQYMHNFELKLQAGESSMYYPCINKIFQTTLQVTVGVCRKLYKCSVGIWQQCLPGHACMQLTATTINKVCHPPHPAQSGTGLAHFV